MSYRDTTGERHEVEICGGLVVLQIVHEGGRVRCPLGVEEAERLARTLRNAADEAADFEMDAA